MLDRLTTRLSDLRTSHDLIRLIIGASLFHTVCVSFFYFSGPQPIAFELGLNASMSIACITAVVLAHKGVRLAGVSMRVSGHILLLGAVIFLPMASRYGFSPTLLVGVVAGTAATLVAPLYFSQMASYSSRSTAIACGGAFFIGMAVNIILGALPQILSTILLSCAVIGSLFCLRALDKPASATDGHQQKHAHNTQAPNSKTISTSGRFFTPLVCTFAISLAYRIVDVIAAGASQPSAFVIAISQTGGLLAALVFAAYYAREGRVSVSSLLNIIFVFFATGLLFLPFFPAEYACALNVVAATGWKLAVLSLLFVAIRTYASDRRLYAAISLAWSLPRLGLLCGLGVSFLFDADQEDSLFALFALSIIAIYVMLIALWVTNYRARKMAEKRAEQAETFVEKIEQSHDSIREARCSDLAERFKLTQRERDVLSLLSQGRDVGFICEELFLAKNTVKSYQRSIYAKMGVHSKQEIINLVKREK